jgi:hypothetical protein
MGQSPSWEDNSFSATQEIPRILLSPKVHHRIHNSPSPVPILSQIDPVYISIQTLEDSIHVWIFQVVSFFQVSLPKPCMHLSSRPYVLHALPISVYRTITLHKFYFFKTIYFMNLASSGKNTRTDYQKVCLFMLLLLVSAIIVSHLQGVTLVLTNSSLCHIMSMGKYLMECLLSTLMDFTVKLFYTVIRCSKHWRSFHICRHTLQCRCFYVYRVSNDTREFKKLIDTLKSHYIYSIRAHHRWRHNGIVDARLFHSSYWVTSIVNWNNLLFWVITRRLVKN